MKTQKHTWTEDERQILRSQYQGNRASVERLATAIGVTPAAVRGQLSAMGVRKKAPRQRWSKDDDRKLEQLAHTHPPHVIAKKMGRSTTAVTVRIKVKGYSRRDRDGWYTATDVARILGHDPKWVTRRIEAGQLRAVKHHRNSERANGTGQHPWRITAAALRNFIRTYPQDLQGRNMDVVAVVDLIAGLKTPQA